MPGVWKVTLPNSFFGKYNPYKDLIKGDWFTDKGRPHHTGEVYLNGKSLYETHLLERVLNPAALPRQQGSRGFHLDLVLPKATTPDTYIYANFHDKDPNQELVEINVRDSCFYPDQPGRDYITIRGFHMSQAATQWAAPTAEQIGLIGTHWSKGWIIENNVISDSKCSGITLGKDRADRPQRLDQRSRARTAPSTTTRSSCARSKIGWSREKIGSHIVRNNTIFNCEQTGIAGSLGAVFSQITNNHIYNIWAKRQFTGAEMAGIKLHARHRRASSGTTASTTPAAACGWTGWPRARASPATCSTTTPPTTSSSRSTTDRSSWTTTCSSLAVSLRDMSEGGAYAHNLMTGRIVSRPEPRRSTPYHQAHSTALAGLSNTTGGDNRFYNNVLGGQRFALRLRREGVSAAHRRQCLLRRRPPLCEGVEPAGSIRR